MAEQNTAPKALTHSVNTAAKHFALQVSKYLESVVGRHDNPEAMRLVANLCIKIQATMDEAKDPFTWEQIDSNKFVMDAVKIVLLNLDAANNECYPIPYRNTTTKKIDIQCSPSAKGLVKLLMQHYAGSSKITRFNRYIIKEGEHFKIIRKPGNDVWEYEENVFGTGKTVGYVTIVSFEDGTSSVMAHSKADIEKRRAASKAPNSPAWTKWYDEMALAKAARRHVNELPMIMPKDVQEAMNDLDDEEQPMKDVTPPTIAIDAPKAAEVSTPDPAPAKVQDEAPAQPEPKKRTRGNREEPQIDLGFMN